MNPDIESMAAIMRGFRNGHDRLEALRIKEIRESDIVREAPILNGMFRSAKYLGISKPVTGLVELAKLHNKMNR